MSTYHDRFHEKYPDAYEPKLPVHIYGRLLDIMDEDSAFQILTDVEDGKISVEEVEQKYL